MNNIPFLGIPDTPIVSTTQRHLPISDVCDDVVLFKDGGASVVMESTSLNFSLLSEKEQEAVIAAYAALINSLSFSLQIVVRTKRKDISSYMNYLSEASRKLTNPGLVKLLASYKSFILESVKKKNVLGKKFYIVIPFSPLELGVTKSVLSVTKGNRPLPFPKSYVIKKAKIVLYPKRDHLIRQSTRLGIKLRQLNTVRLIELYHDIYNPEMPVIIKETAVGEVA
ncbi:MAG: hypothetical protein Q8P91_00945 [bacterium]|nr:hypothetical protein [bacterium]